MSTLTRIAGAGLDELGNNRLSEVFNDAELSALTHYFNSSQRGKDASLVVIEIHAHRFPAIPAAKLRLVSSSKGAQA